MIKSALLKQVKNAVHEIEMEAQILLYGSRARKDSIDLSDLIFESSKETTDLRLWASNTFLL